MSTSIASSILFRSAVASSSRATTRRNFVTALSSSAQQHPISFTNNNNNNRCKPTIATRQYSLDGPNSGGSPLSLFSGGRGGSSESSPFEQSLEINRWPISKTNTILNIVPQGKRMVVERFGKLHAIHESGYFIAIPFVDSIAYVIDVRERAVDILPQSAITRDNVSVEVSGNLFVRVVDPERAAYGARNPLYAAMMHAQSAMRSAIGELELDEILHNRAGLNTIIKGSLQEAAVAWGLEIRRYELTEITPDEQIRIVLSCVIVCSIRSI